MSRDAVPTSTALERSEDVAHLAPSALPAIASALRTFWRFVDGSDILD
jgi:hypothetical protein